MSIYATLWRLKFPRAQAVPPHVGSPTAVLGYDNGDPYADFLPPALIADEGGHVEFMRAVVIMTGETKKGTTRHPQEYSNPLLTLDGKQYASMTFDELHNHVCDALRGDRQRRIIETISRMVGVRFTSKMGGLENCEQVHTLGAGMR